ncbi:MAG: hypothetical protein WD512_04960 [Candidatus Paceibacterota bacterium]
MTQNNPPPLNELYKRLRGKDPWLIRNGYCVDIGGNCDLYERCYCLEELEELEEQN